MKLRIKQRIQSAFLYDHKTMKKHFCIQFVQRMSDTRFNIPNKYEETYYLTKEYLTID